MNQKSLVSKIIEASRIIEEKSRNYKGSYVIVDSKTATVMNSVFDEMVNNERRVEKIKKIYNL